MVEEASKAIGFGQDALWVTIGVLISIGVIALLVMNLIKTYRELRKPKVAEGKSIEDRLQSDYSRLNELEDMQKKQEKESTLVLRAMVAMLHHMVDGNNTTALKDCQKSIEEYLLTGRVHSI